MRGRDVERPAAGERVPREPRPLRQCKVSEEFVRARVPSRLDCRFYGADVMKIVRPGDIVTYSVNNRVDRVRSILRKTGNQRLLFAPSRAKIPRTPPVRGIMPQIAALMSTGLLRSGKTRTRLDYIR